LHTTQGVHQQQVSAGVNEPNNGAVMGTLNSYSEWVEELEMSRYGRKSLTLEKARTLARTFPGGWYVAPLASGWTIGKGKAQGGRRARFPVLGGDGAPLTFDSASEARSFMMSELKIASPEVVWCH
jgi:hypothetical protein